MRSFSRALVIGALALPLALTGAGFAAADAGAQDKCGHHKTCGKDKPKVWDWDWTWGDQDNDTGVINAGIIG